MGFQIERLAKQITARKAKGKATPLADTGIWNDIDALTQLKRAEWISTQRALEAAGIPQASVGPYSGLNAYPPTAAIATTSISGEVGLWSAALYTPLAANSVLAPAAFELYAAGRMTTSTSPGNITITPRMGTSTSGITLGATSATALTASITNAFWELHGRLTVRTIGAAGNNSTAIGDFRFVSTQGTSGGVAGPATAGTGMNILFGTTGASYDSTVASGLFIGVTHTVTSITYATEQIHWEYK